MAAGLAEGRKAQPGGTGRETADKGKQLQQKLKCLGCHQLVGRTQCKMWLADQLEIFFAFFVCLFFQTRYRTRKAPWHLGCCNQGFIMEINPKQP